jgi:hypothetical protein
MSANGEFARNDNFVPTSHASLNVVERLRHLDSMAA